MPISPGGTHAHIYTRNVPMHTSVESGYLLYLQNQCTVRKRKQGDKWMHAHQSRSATYSSSRVPFSLFKTAWLCWCMMAQHLRLAEVHCMSSLDHMLCQGGCLDIPILQCTAVFTDTCMLLEAPPVWSMYTLEHSMHVWMSPFLISAWWCSLTCCFLILFIHFIITVMSTPVTTPYKKQFASCTSYMNMHTWNMGAWFLAWLCLYTMIKDLQ